MRLELALPKLTLRYAGDPDAHIVLGGLRSKGSRLPPQALAAGSHRLFVRSKKGDALGEAALTVTEGASSWTVVVTCSGVTQAFEVQPEGPAPSQLG